MNTPDDADRVDQVLALVRTLAPADVVETVDWLRSSGWQPRRALGSGPFGLWVEFLAAPGVIVVGCDRSQWMLDIKLPEWKRPKDLAIIFDTINGRTDWSQGLPIGRPSQLPPGTCWRSALPEALRWLASTPDPESLLHSMELKRSRSLLPPRRRARRAAQPDTGGRSA
ncbi:MAG TPA: hypothetical protein VED59_06195 [Acidimicrobiales bacterium]|nr:hypothetical protein [Acidimicrobiales bacterium]